MGPTARVNASGFWRIDVSSQSSDGLILPPCRVSRFIPIGSPKLRPAPPTGPDWLHEVKFDGFRIQLHKVGDEVRLFSRNGKDFTDRFPSIPAAVLRLPAERGRSTASSSPVTAKTSRTSTPCCGGPRRVCASGASTS